MLRSPLEFSMYSMIREFGEFLESILELIGHGFAIRVK